MSSHHFVREQQEPALLILGLENISYDQIAGLLEWVPTVLVSENSIEKVLSWGIKVDVMLVSAKFQLENIYVLEKQHPVKLVEVEGDNFMEEGIRFLLESKHEAVHLIGIPHVHALELTPLLGKINLTVMDGDWRYYPVTSGSFKKWFSAGEIQLLGNEGMPLEIKNSNGELILPIVYMTCLEVPDGITEIVSSGVFWIGERVV